MRWPVVNLRRLAKLGTGHTPSRQHPEYWEDCTIPWLTLADVWQLRDDTRTVVTETSERISELGVHNSSAVVHPAGTVAMSRTASVGFSCILGADMATSQDFVTWTCGPSLDPRFLLHSLRGQRDRILGMRAGSTHQTIYMPDVERISTPFPSIHEQRAIADFLDTETARIDALIAKKRCMVELLDARSRAERDEHVLRGLDPVGGSTPQEYPAHWGVAALGVLVELHRGYDLPADGRTDGRVPVVSSGGVSGWNSVAMCEPPGVVTGRYGTVGEVFYLDTPYWPLNTTLYVSDFRGHQPRWVFHLLQALPLDYDAEKSAVTGVNRNILGLLRAPVPPLSEQATIARLLDLAAERQERLTEKITRQVALLREHRQALITAAVTGGADVPGVAA